MSRYAIPIDFQAYFWDCDFKKLNLKKYRQFVLGRLLHYGGVKAIKWIPKHFLRTEIRQYLKSRGKKELDSRSFIFWLKLLSIKEIW